MKKKTAFDVERGFITKLLNTKDYKTIKDANIHSGFFSGEHAKAFKYISDCKLQDGEVPTLRAFKHRFPAYVLDEFEDDVDTEETLLYWCNRLKEKVRHNSLAASIEVAAACMEGRDTDRALKELKKTIGFVENALSDTVTADLTKTQDRKEAYMKRKASDGMVGLPTGIRFLDSILHGLADATLTTCIAKPGVGKTWLEILIGSYCMQQRVRVLQFVTEMSEDIMRDRYEAMVFSRMYGEMNYSDFKRGNLPPKTEKDFFRFLERDLPRMEPLLIKSATGVTAMAAEIDDFKPDLVLVDSAYLMEDDNQSKEDWLRVTNITRDIKKLAKSRKLPIFINSQADQNTSVKTGPGLGDIKYAQSIAMDSDNVFAIYRDEQMLLEEEMGVKILKQREGVLGKFIMRWSFSKMDFECIYQENVGGEESDEEETDSIGVGGMDDDDDE